MLDWELCTLGDPLADLGYLGVYWAGPDRTALHNDPTSLPGFPMFGEVVARYAERTGSDVSHIDYYVAFSSFRLAVISEGVYARYLAARWATSTSPRCSTSSARPRRTWPCRTRRTRGRPPVRDDPA